MEKLRSISKWLLAAVMRSNATTGWISISDSMPNLYKPVLVCNTDGMTQDERDAEIATLHEGDIFYYIAPWDYRLFSIAIVTHWMPLPDAPEV